MLTPKMTGIFDCRKYDSDKKKLHNQREWLADTDNIAFSALFPIDQVPEIFMVNGTLDSFARPAVSRREKRNAEAEGREPIEDVIAVKFKIKKNTRWFDSRAKPCDRPTNVELEENRWNVQIDFNRKEKDPADNTKSCGYWVNNIMVAKIDNNPFAGQAFDPIEEEEPEDEPKEEQRHDDLPFGD